MTEDAAFANERVYLTQLAYRLLGGVQDAEDVVQEAWLRWQEAGRPGLAVPRAWFTRVVTRLCLDRLRADERRREQYFGEWLPEPWIDSEQRAELDETLSQALLHTLHQLSAGERAAFLLHDVFGYEFAEVAAMLDLEPANCRQLAVRARERLGARSRPAAALPACEVERLGSAFFSALRAGDVDGLRGLLRDDVVLRADGGGKVSAVHYPLFGVERIVRFFDRLLVRTGWHRDLRVETRWWNGAPGFLLFDGVDGLVGAYQFEVEGDRIARILVQRNPDKLRGFAR